VQDIFNRTIPDCWCRSKANDPFWLRKRRRLTLKAKALTSLIALVCVGAVSICGAAWALDEAILTPTNDSVKAAEDEATGIFK
jgi:hypothetical protein